MKSILFKNGGKAGYKNIEQNVKNSCFGASCIAGFLKLFTSFIILTHKTQGCQQEQLYGGHPKIVKVVSVDNQKVVTRMTKFWY